jgi:uncharacterized protein (TIGR02246 family)
MRRRGIELTDQSKTADEAEIAIVLLTLAAGFLHRDADSLVNVYSADADWTNAQGISRHGRADIIEYHRAMFAEKDFSIDEYVALPQLSLRFVTATVAVARSYSERRAAPTDRGYAPKIRRNQSLKVLAKQPDGTWLIISDIYMDNDEESSADG